MPAVPGVGDAAVAGNWQLQFVKGGVGVAILVSLHDSQAAPADKVGGMAAEVAFAKRLVALL